MQSTVQNGVLYVRAGIVCNYRQLRCPSILCNGWLTNVSYVLCNDVRCNQTILTMWSLCIMTDQLNVVIMQHCKLLCEVTSPFAKRCWFCTMATFLQSMCIITLICTLTGHKMPQYRSLCIMTDFWAIFAVITQNYAAFCEVTTKWLVILLFGIILHMD